jgi:hypothetical protein
MPKTELVGINDKGRRVGQFHPQAKFSDHEIELVRALIESGMTHKEIKDKMDCSLDLIKKISCGDRRQRPTKWKRAPVKEDRG